MADAAASSGYEIVLSRDRVIRLPRGFEPERVSSLMRWWKRHRPWTAAGCPAPDAAALGFAKRWTIDGGEAPAFSGRFSCTSARPLIYLNRTCHHRC